MHIRLMTGSPGITENTYRTHSRLHGQSLRLKQKMDQRTLSYRTGADTITERKLKRKHLI